MCCSSLKKSDLFFHFQVLSIMSKTTPSELSPWRAYERAPAECIFLRLCPPSWAESWIAFRWRLLRVCHRRCRLPPLALLPGRRLSSPSFWTLGEFLALLGNSALWLALAISGSRNAEDSGTAPDMALALVFLTAARNSPLTLALGIPFERQLFWHKVAGVFSVVLGVYHGYVALVNGDEDDEGGEDDRRKLEGQGATPVSAWTLGLFTNKDENLSGSLLLLTMMLAAAAALPPIRRARFEIFLVSHILFAAAGFGFAAMHGCSLSVLAAVVWVFDEVLSLFTGRNFSLHNRVEITRLPAGVVRLSWEQQSAPLHHGGTLNVGGPFHAGQYCFVCVPELGVQFHPFSYSSAPGDSRVTLHIRALGNWTKALHSLAERLHKQEGADGGGGGPPGGGSVQDEVIGAQNSVEAAVPAKTASLQEAPPALSDPPVEQHPPTDLSKKRKVFLPRAYIAGPFGAPSVNVYSSEFRTFVLVSGGIGVTPLHSFLRQLLEEQRRGRPLDHVLFLWSVADKCLLQTDLEFDSVAAASSWSRAEYEQGIPSQQARDALPLSFQPPLELDEDIGRAEGYHGFDLQIEFFLTRVRDAADFDAANIRPELQKHVVFGQRPDLAAKLRAVAERPNLRGGVAVLVCGPAAMVSDVQVAAAREGFACHAEHFNF